MREWVILLNAKIQSWVYAVDPYVEFCLLVLAMILIASIPLTVVIAVIQQVRASRREKKRIRDGIPTLRPPFR